MTDVLDRITECARHEKSSGAELIEWVREARGSGFTWQQIGGALGVTRQAAIQRFGRHVNGTH